jgi:8-amino-7-oxononanoate synthase
LLQKTRTYIFATAAPPLLASALQASLRLIEAGDDRRAHLAGLITRLRQGLSTLPGPTGWRLIASGVPIQALVIGSNEQALWVMDGLREQGIWVPAIRPPTVPVGTARLRIALSAAHTTADVDQLVTALQTLAAQRQRESGT